MADIVLTSKEKGLQKISSFFEFLGFYIEGEFFGAPLKDILEISKLLPIVPVPFSSPKVLGVVNVRGEIIPIIDLKAILRLNKKRQEERVVLVESPKGKLGFLVDEIVGVIRIEEEKLEQNPMREKYSEYVRGVAQLAEGLIRILDFERVVEDL